MVLTTVFATAGAICAGGTAAFANAFYFNKDNDKATLGWSAVFALAGGLAAGGIGYGIEAAYDAVTDDASSSVIEAQANVDNKVNTDYIIAPKQG